MWDGERGGLAIWCTGHIPGGPFSIEAVWGPINAPKHPRMPLGALKMHQNAQNASEIAYVTNRMTCDSLHFKAFWGLSGPFTMWDMVSICGTLERSCKCGTVPRKEGHLVTLTDSEAHVLERGCRLERISHTCDLSLIKPLFCMVW